MAKKPSHITLSPGDTITFRNLWGVEIRVLLHKDGFHWKARNSKSYRDYRGPFTSVSCALEDAAIFLSAPHRSPGD